MQARPASARYRSGGDGCARDNGDRQRNLSQRPSNGDVLPVMAAMESRSIGRQSVAPALIGKRPTMVEEGLRR
jgi:hypothetical protein